MWQTLKHDMRFWIGLIFLSGLMLVSIGNTLFFDGEIREVTMLYNEKGQVEAAPFPPSSQFWFGSDSKGRDLFQLIIEGQNGQLVQVYLLRFCELSLEEG